jgi:hypothetical protein
MKNIILLAVLGCLFSCESKTYTKSEIEKFQESAKLLDDQVKSKRNELSDLNQKVNSKNAELNALSKNNPKYMLKIRFKQSRISLDIGEHLKDSMNSGYFEIPVDKEFYDSVKVGDKIVDKFRGGSFIISGSFSDWVLKVEDKRIK